MASPLTSLEGVRRSDGRGQSLTLKGLYAFERLTSHPGDSNPSFSRAPAQKHWGLVPIATSLPVISSSGSLWELPLWLLYKVGMYEV